MANDDEQTFHDVKPPRKLWGFDSLPAHQLDSVFRIDPTSDVGLRGSQEYERD